MRGTSTDTAPTLASRGWRDFGRLAVEALAIGLLSSLLLALAVLLVARGRQDTRYVAAPAAAVQAPSPPASAS